MPDPYHQEVGPDHTAPINDLIHSEYQAPLFVFKPMITCDAILQNQYDEQKTIGAQLVWRQQVTKAHWYENGRFTPFILITLSARELLLAYV
jgi:hypothetical protein